MAGLLVTAGTVEASAIALKLSDGTATYTVLDNAAGDLNTDVGVILFNGTVGAWNINATTGVGEQHLIPGSMDLGSLNVSTGGTLTTLNIWLTMYDITTVYPGFALEFGGATTNSAVTYSALVSDANQLFDGTTFATLGPYSGGAFSGATSNSVFVSAPYSLTQLLSIEGQKTGTAVSFSGNAELNAVPEPGSMVLLGTGLFGVAAAARRRLRLNRH